MSKSKTTKKKEETNKSDNITISIRIESLNNYYLLNNLLNKFPEKKLLINDNNYFTKKCFYGLFPSIISFFKINKERIKIELTDIEKEEFLKLLKCYKNDKNDQHIEKLDKYIFRFIEPQISKYRSIIENKQLERSGLIFMINNEPFGFNEMSNYFNNIPFFGNNINQSVVEFINKVKQCIFCGKSLILVKESNIARYLKGYEMKLFNKEGQLLQIRQQLVDNEMINKKLKNCKVELRYKGYYDRVNYDEYKLINDDINKEILNIITINAFDLLSQLKREITLLIMFMEKAKDELVHFPSLYEHDQFIECNKYFNVEIGSICKYYDEWMMEMKMNIFSELLCWRMKAFESFKLMNLCDINIIIV